MAISEQYELVREANIKAREVHMEYKKNYERAERAEEMFLNNKGELNEEDVEALSGVNASDMPKTPKFPLGILAIAMIKDILDFLTLTGIGYVVALVMSAVSACIIFFWGRGKMRSMGKNKAMIKSVWKKYTMRYWTRFIVVLGADFVPFINFLPLESLFVLLAYYEETKLVKGMHIIFKN